MIDFGLRRWRNRPYGHLCAAPQDDLFAIDADEFMEHGGTEYRRHPCRKAVQKRTVRTCVLFYTDTFPQAEVP